jgi:protein-L-isoaspartate(D-aspartate) O-methyltransferase
MSSVLAAARLNMVENQVRTNDVTDLAVQDAMRVVPREDFCPPEKRFLAYAETSVPYGGGWHLAQPRDVAKLLQALLPAPGERALALAAPYAAAVLRQIGLSVDERPGGPGLADPVEAEPYDVLICEAAVAKTPQAWIDAVGPRGRLALVERQGPVGKARLYLRGADGALASREIFDATPPYAPGFEPQASFAL